MVALFLLILLGVSLLIFVEEKEWQAYVKLALYLVFITSIASFF